jgi:hypothetical protein
LSTHLTFISQSRGGKILALLQVVIAAAIVVVAVVAAAIVVVMVMVAAVMLVLACRGGDSGHVNKQMNNSSKL